MLGLLKSLPLYVAGLFCRTSTCGSELPYGPVFVTVVVVVVVVVVTTLPWLSCPVTEFTGPLALLLLFTLLGALEAGGDGGSSLFKFWGAPGSFFLRWRRGMLAIVVLLQSI